jgi:TRAP-type uncharacterized transport system fused permease subunit
MRGGSILSDPKPRETADFLTKAVKIIIGCIGVGISLFHLYTGAFGTLEAYSQRFVHLLTLMTLAFLIYPASKKWSAGRNLLFGLPPAALCGH